MAKPSFSLIDPGSWTDDQKIYFEGVDRMVKSRADIRFSNGLPEHAAYLILTFFRNAQSRVRIFCEHLTQTAENAAGNKVNIYSDENIVDAAIRFSLRPDAKLDIVLRDRLDVERQADSQSHPLIGGVIEALGQSEAKQKLRLCRVSPEVLKFLEDEKYLHDMMVMDQRAWRIETQAGTNGVKAQVNLGDGKGAKWVSGLFDRLYLPNSKDMLLGMR